MKIVAVGEILWDMIGDATHLGGAPLNFAFHVSRLGNQVPLVSAVGEDDLGKHALQAMQTAGLSIEHIQRVPGHPTGTVTVAIGSPGSPEYTIHRPAAYDFPVLSADSLNQLVAWKPDWIC